ncbi:hypothetical protein [Rhodopirellula sp. MGV]|uniref:hypothetical protein n=1 Tax=Rhodopirellula sp. MGV TaxID=2023130 RepID=UPI000B95D620|nr:hypothetical protein [Rhodopirellula sp. MGV]OYP34554.1 hypothetical protein CGZ80_14275 [Rhodopirellula sp. MGV]PNY36730.1 hypothetical protein C2E31_11475 [Rhodopirellula baltica]
MIENTLKGHAISGDIRTALLTADIDGSGGQQQASDQTFTINGTEVIYLPYRPNAINFVIPQGKDVISSNFTGCYMAAYKQNGALKIAHVATPSCNAAWATLKNEVEVVAEFKPSDHVPMSALQAIAQGGTAPQIMGIYTNMGYCIAAAATQANGNLIVTHMTLVKAS